MRRSHSLLVVPAALLALAGTVSAQTPAVEFRIVERGTGSGTASLFQLTPATPTANFAVQARITGGAGSLGNFAFDIVGVGEPDANGTLSRLLISNADGTYTTNSANSTNNSVGRGGMAAPYTYLAGISPTFLGTINTSAGTFTNTTGNQEIGLVTGSPTGNSLLLVTDPNGTGNPDTYPGFGMTATLDPTIANTYFGASGNWVDIYRFKYTTTNFAARSFQFTLLNASAQIMTGLQLSNGVWGPVQSNASVTVTPALMPFPAPSSGALFTLGLLLATKRRRGGITGTR